MERQNAESSDRDASRTIVAPENETPDVHNLTQMIQPSLDYNIGYDHPVDGSMQELLYFDELSRMNGIGHPTLPTTNQDPSVNAISRGMTDQMSNFLNCSRPHGGEMTIGASYSQSVALMDGNPLGYTPRIPGNNMMPHLNQSMEEMAPMASREMSEPMGTHQWMLSGEDEPRAAPSTSPQRKGRVVVRKPRWKPNNEQMRLLDDNYNSSSSPPLPKLLKALQKVEPVTVEQFLSWLRDRPLKLGNASLMNPDLSAQLNGGGGRITTPSRRENGLRGAQQHASNHPTAQEKRLREEKLEEVGAQFPEILDSVISEMSSVLAAIDVREILRLCRSIKNARYVVCHGVGVEGLVMHAFARALNDVGVQSYSLTDISMPQVGEDDLFIVSAGSSFCSAVSALALEAKRLGTPVVAFTAHPAADMLFARDIIRIPSQTMTPSMPIMSKKLMKMHDTVSFLPDGDESVLNLGTSYDLGLRLTHEALICMLASQTGEAQQEDF